MQDVITIASLKELSLTRELAAADPAIVSDDGRYSIQISMRLILSEVLIRQKQHSSGLVHENSAGPLDHRSIIQPALIRSDAASATC